MRRKAIKELRRNLKWNGVLFILWNNKRAFIFHPERVYQIGAQLSSGGFV